MTEARGLRQCEVRNENLFSQLNVAAPFSLFQSRTPALVFEHVNNTDFKVQCELVFSV